MMWRTHSSVPRRHSCRRPATTESPYATRVSRRVSLDTARTECVRHLIEPSVRKARLSGTPSGQRRSGIGSSRLALVERTVGRRKRQAKAPAPQLPQTLALMPTPGDDRVSVCHQGVETSLDTARTSAQCRLVLPLADTSLNCGADALVCSRPPGRLFVSGKHWILRANCGSRGTRADLGVCPTDSAPFAILAKLSGIAHECVRHLIEPSVRKARLSGTPSGQRRSGIGSSRLALVERTVGRRKRQAKAPAPQLPQTLALMPTPGDDRVSVCHQGVETSLDTARTSAQCRLVLPLADTSLNCGADALVCSRPPGRLFVSGKHLILRANCGSRGTLSGMGVCPSYFAPWTLWVNFSDLAHECVRH